MLGTCDTKISSYHVSNLSPSFTEFKIKAHASDTDDDFTCFSDSDSHFSFNSKVNIPVHKHPSSPEFQSTTPVTVVNRRNKYDIISSKLRSNVIDLEVNSAFSQNKCLHSDDNENQKSHLCARISMEESIYKLTQKPKNLTNYCQLNIKTIFDHTCNAPTISEKHLSLKRENIEFIQTEKIVTDNFLIKGQLNVYRFQSSDNLVFSSESSSECDFNFEDKDDIENGAIFNFSKLGCYRIIASLLSAV